MVVCFLSNIACYGWDNTNLRYNGVREVRFLNEVTDKLHGGDYRLCFCYMCGNSASSCSMVCTRGAVAGLIRAAARAAHNRGR